MHRDIAMELECDSAANIGLQQAALETWRTTYNQERPHEAIGMKVPADLYVRSPRRFEPGEVALDYPMDYLRRRVNQNGAIRLQSIRIGVSEALAGWDVGLRHDRSHRYGLWFCRLRLGEVDLKTEQFQATAT